MAFCRIFFLGVWLIGDVGYVSAQTVSAIDGPCCNRTARTVIVSCPVPDYLLLNASGIVEDPGNPQIYNVTWSYSNRWSAVKVGNRLQFLNITIPSLQAVEELFDGEAVSATAMNDHGTTHVDFNVKVSAITKPPGNPMCSVSEAAPDTVTCNWSAVSGIGGAQVDGYHILLKNSSGYIFANRTANRLSYSFYTSNTVFVLNSAYAVEIYARNAMCEGPAATTDQFTTPGPPSSPQNVKCSPSSQTEVSLSWTSPVYQHPDLPVTGYVVAYEGKMISTPSNQLHQDVRCLLSNTTYNFNVTAKNAFGMSEPAQTSCSTFPPGIPTAVILSQAQPIPGGVQLFWIASDPGMAGLRIKFYTVIYWCQPTNERMVKSLGNVLTYQLFGLGEKVMCTLAVTATNSINNTSPQSSASKRNATTGETVAGDQGLLSLRLAVFTGIVISCFVAGCFVGAVATTIMFHKVFKSKNANSSLEEETVTVAAAFELATIPRSLRNSYAEVITPEQTLPMTSNPAYRVNASQ